MPVESRRSTLSSLRTTQGGEMPAVGVAQAAGLVVVFRIEKCGVGGFGRVLEEQSIDRAQEALGFVDGHGALAAQVGLKVGHEQRGSDAFTGDVADDEAEAIATERQEIVIITADVARLLAASCVVERSKGRQFLREEPGLHVLCDFQFLGEAALRFPFVGIRAALGLDGVGGLIKAHERERIAVDVLELRGYASPDWRFGIR